MKLIFFLASTGAFAGPFQFSFSAPAVTTGPVQGEAFSFSFVTPDFFTGFTDITTFPSLVVSSTIDPAMTELTFAIALPTGVGFVFSDLTTASILGVMDLEPMVIDHTGVYITPWQLGRITFGSGQVLGDIVQGVLTVTDAPLEVPEPATVYMLPLVLGFLVHRRRNL